MTRLLTITALAAVLSGCTLADARYMAAMECLEDRQCRRELRRSDALDDLRELSEWRERKSRRHRKRLVRHRKAVHRVSRRRSRHEDGDTCKPVTSATGAQAQSVENAERRALLAWQGIVRFQWGEQYLDFDRARDRRVVCSPSDVQDTVGGKIQDKLLGISHFRCRLSARPCAADSRRVDQPGAGDDDDNDGTGSD